MKQDVDIYDRLIVQNNLVFSFNTSFWSFIS